VERFLLKKRGRHWDDVPEPSFTARSCSASAMRLFKEKAAESGRMGYLKAYITYQRLQRRERFLFPEAALREALLNAVVHKDYSSGIPIQISVRRKIIKEHLSDPVPLLIAKWEPLIAVKVERFFTQ
jgi:hypothetical protein